MPNPISAASRSQYSIDDYTRAVSAAATAKPPPTERHAPTLAQREALSKSVDDLIAKYAASRKQAPQPKQRTAADCVPEAGAGVLVCASSIAGAAAASPTVVGTFVAGAAAGATCTKAYFEYLNCLEGK